MGNPSGKFATISIGRTFLYASPAVIPLQFASHSLSSSHVRLEIVNHMQLVAKVSEMWNSHLFFNLSASSSNQRIYNVFAQQGGPHNPILAITSWSSSYAAMACVTACSCPSPGLQGLPFGGQRCILIISLPPSQFCGHFMLGERARSLICHNFSASCKTPSLKEPKHHLHLANSQSSNPQVGLRIQVCD